MFNLIEQNEIAKRYYDYLLQAKTEGGFSIFIPSLYKDPITLFPDFAKVLYRVHDLVTRWSIDPIIYFKAQLRYYKQKFLNPMVLADKGGISRYNKWVSEVKEKYIDTSVSPPVSPKDAENIRIKADKIAFIIDCQKVGDKVATLCLHFNRYSPEFVRQVLKDLVDKGQVLKYIEYSNPTFYQKLRVGG